MNYQEACRKGKLILEEKKIEDAANDAWLLLEYVSGMSRARFYVDGFSPMKAEEEAKYFTLIEKRGSRIPLQHLTGVQEFMGLPFKVNEHVLVPRQDTEILVEEVEHYLKQNPKAEVLDMCTGSGCIAISLKVRNAGICCTGVDISKEALKVSVYNKGNLQADVCFMESDMFANVSGKYDVIVSNPPYIPTKVIEELEEEVKLHDPFGALDGKEDGLFFYRILAEKGPQFLKNGGRIYLEIGHDQSQDVEKLLSDAGFTEISTKKDLAGLDRVVSALYNN